MRPFWAILESWFLLLIGSYQLHGSGLLLDSQSKHRPFHPVKTRVRRIAANFARDWASPVVGFGQACMTRNKGV
jgi:hypothetical protein